MLKLNAGACQLAKDVPPGGVAGWPAAGGSRRREVWARAGVPGLEASAPKGQVAWHPVSHGVQMFRLRDFSKCADVK